jgi:hypothetical protein
MSAKADRKAWDKTLGEHTASQLIQLSKSEMEMLAAYLSENFGRAKK